jgi:hypothetical protein
MLEYKIQKNWQFQLNKGHNSRPVQAIVDKIKLYLYIVIIIIV